MRMSDILNFEELLELEDWGRRRKGPATPSSKIEIDKDLGNWELAVSKLPMHMPKVTGPDKKFVAKLTHKRKENTYIYGVGDTQEEAKDNAIAKLTPKNLKPMEYSSITADLNAPFTTEYLKDNASLWFKVDKIDNEPVMIMANKEYVESYPEEIKKQGFKKASKGRTGTTGGATTIWGFPISKVDMARAGLIPNYRYTLEYTTDDQYDNSIFVMNPDSKTEGPHDKYRMGVPGVTIAASELREYQGFIEERADDNGNTSCWKGYRKVGLKKKGGKMVNDCRPVKK